MTSLIDPQQVPAIVEAVSRHVPRPGDRRRPGRQGERAVLHLLH